MDPESMLTILGGVGAVAVVLLLWRPGQKKNKGVIGTDVSVSAEKERALDRFNGDAEEEWEITPITTSRSGRQGLRGEADEDLSISTADDVAPPETDSRNAPEDLIVVLNIMAHQGQAFDGAAILNATHDAGLVFGDMQIFHYIYNSAPLFSLANALNPGSFDINAIENTTTPGLTLFLRLPGPIDGLAAFDRMYSVATQMASTLGGEVCDARRTILTAQALEKQREDIAEHQRGWE